MIPLVQHRQAMTDAGEISEDRGFKALFSAYPVETFEVFVPALLTERGAPSHVEMLAQESALPDLGDPSRFLDVALLASWPDGYQAVIMLVEHWSDARKIDLRRVNWYVADLALRHPHAVIFPAILVTDPTAREVQGRLEMIVVGRATLILDAQVTQITASDLPRLRALQNRVAATMALLAAHDAVEALVAFVQDMTRAPGPLDDVERFLPFAMKLAKLPESDALRFRRRLEETGMVNVITEMKNEAKAKVFAQGQIDEIRRLAAKGVLSLNAARAEVHDLLISGVISQMIAEEALAKLG